MAYIATLTDCTIPADTMQLYSSYKVKIAAQYATNTIMNTERTVHIDTASPPVKVASVIGGNRLFSTSEPFNLTVTITSDPKYAQYTWYCLDEVSGSACFSTEYQYISLANT